MTRVLVLTTLFPNAAQPNHGIFVENRLRRTLALGGLEALVLAPVPYFPSRMEAFGRYAAFARAPRRERRHGIEILHPRYVVVPKIGSLLAPALLYRAALAAVKKLAARGRFFDVIDAHYLYPDGVAAAMLARRLRIPFVLTARGSDVTQIPRNRSARTRILMAMEDASATVTVCEDLRRRLIDLGADGSRIVTLRNGVDLDLFTPGDRAAARAALGLDRFTLLSVGHLIPRKGHHLIIEAMQTLPDCQLLIAGGGPMRDTLTRLASELRMTERVRLLGDIPHAQLPAVYRAADALVLASEREGWANVLLESIACGTPVAATDVNGTSEVVRSEAAGRLIAERSPDSIAAAIRLLRRNMPRPEDTRRYAEGFGWEVIARANKALLLSAARTGYAGRDGSTARAAAEALT
ncbi:MAG TPA: glycosyltransferase family 4 protein [Rhizomicrobium sp.]|nr:glycosyltransferase family 4 protein [Rhizomicrobium sp.]